jgi:hypothetical protein
LVRTTERKLWIMRQLIDGEIEAARAEIAWIESRGRGDSPAESLQLKMQHRRAVTRFEVLNSIK